MECTNHERAYKIFVVWLPITFFSGILCGVSMTYVYDGYSHMIAIIGGCATIVAFVLSAFAAYWCSARTRKSAKQDGQPAYQSIPTEKPDSISQDTASSSE